MTQQTTQWDRFADSTFRTLDRLDWDATAGVYVPQTSFQAGDGFDAEYPDSATITVDAALETPDANAQRDAGGRTETVDLTIYVSAVSVSSIPLTDSGDAGDPPTGVEVDEIRYITETIESQFDGFLELGLTEVDEWP